MARQITKELAEGIARKLKARYEKKKGRAHDLYVVYYNEKRIAQFGIRHGSEKDQGHDFIPGQIFVTAKFAKELGQCPKSYEDWVAEMKSKRKIDKTDEELAAEEAARAAAAEIEQGLNPPQS